MVIIASFFLVSCEPCPRKNSGADSAVEKRAVQTFDQIELQGTGKLYLKQGGTEALHVEADQDVLSFISTTVEDGILSIGSRSTEGKVVGSVAPVIYHVTVKDLKALTIVGAAKVESVNPLNIDNLDLSLSGAGEIDLEVDGEKVIVELNGAGKIRMKGEVEKQVVKINGVGRYEALDLASKQAKLEVDGGGIAWVHTENKLIVKIVGGGMVHYRGSPSIERDIIGLGSVERAD